MKRFIAYSFSLSAILLSEPVWAHEPVYCPQEVICSQNGNASSCLFEQHERGYWNDPVASHYPPSVLQGKYALSYVSAPSYSRDPGYAICVYTHTDVSQTLTIQAKPESNLERLDSPDWRANESWWECEPYTFESCPLFEQDALFVKNNRRYSIIVVPGPITVPTGKYTRLFTDDFTDCANPEACWAEIYTTGEQIGAITVNTQDHLKIIDIQDNIDVKSEINKIEDFNAVEVK